MERLYLFNPFNIKNWTDQEIKLQIDHLIDIYDTESDSLYQYSCNIENLANQNYLIGEMIARLSEQVLLKKNAVDATEKKQVYISRKQWEETQTGKAPAMSYFEACANDFVKDEREKLAKLQSDLTRFKYAYESIEAKMNAIKKKMESIRYEEFGG